MSLRLLAQLTPTPTVEGNRVCGVEILRPGSYKGYDYTADYMDQLVANMNQLEASLGYQPPYRLGHPTQEDTDEVWADPLRVKGHWSNLRIGPEGQVLADCEVADQDELDAIARGQRRYVSVDVLHDYEHQGQNIGPFLKACDAVDAPAVLTAGFLAAHENGEEFNADNLSTRGGSDMSVVERFMSWLGLGEDATEEDFERAITVRTSDGSNDSDESDDTDDDSTTGSDPEVAELREQNRQLAQQLRETNTSLQQLRQERQTEQANARADTALGELRDGGYITPAQFNSLQPVARQLAQDTETMLGKGDEQLTALQSFVEGLRTGGPIVRLGRESTGRSDDEDKSVEEKAGRIAQMASETKE